MTLFDAHTHIFPPSQAAARATIAARDAGFAAIYANPAAKMADVRGLLAALDEAGLERALAAGFAFKHQCDVDEQDEYLLAAARQSAGRIIPLATVNPALPGWRPAAEDALSRGARGFGELRPADQGWDPGGPVAHALCSLAADAGAVLLWHVSEPLGHAYAGKQGGISPAELWAISSAFPTVPMIAAHLGGGLSFYLQMPEVRVAVPNLYFDTATAPLLYDDESVARLVDLAGHHRVLFGSDYPLLSPRRQLQLLQARLPADVALAVCGGNADSLFSDRHDS